jgi:hypothetical protein
MDISSARDYIQTVAIERLQNNQTVRQVNFYGTEIEYLGAAGELAARRFLKIGETLHTHFDRGADIHWRGYKIDVKATRLTPLTEFRFLQWPYTKTIKADLILLTAIDLRTMEAEVIGYAFREEVLRAPINPDRRYPCHEIPIAELHSPWNLFSTRTIRARYTACTQAQAYR